MCGLRLALGIETSSHGNKPRPGTESFFHGGKFPFLTLLQVDLPLGCHVLPWGKWYRAFPFYPPARCPPEFPHFWAVSQIPDAPSKEVEEAQQGHGKEPQCNPGVRHDR